MNKESKIKTTSEINNFNKNEAAKHEKSLQKVHHLIQSINLEQHKSLNVNNESLPKEKKKKKLQV